MASGINKKNILIISSGSPNDNSPKMVMDMLQALGEENDTDLLLKYKIKNNPNVISIYNSQEELLHSVLSFFKSKLYSLLKRKNNFTDNKSLPYYFFGHDDSKPPVNSKRILSKITKQYDFVLIFFWQGMLTSKSINDIYKKLNVPILFWAADMFPMSGGCSYFWDCDRLEKACGLCPGINSTDVMDITKKNFLYKKEMLKDVNSVFLGNTWLNNYALKSKLFKSIDTIYAVLDKDLFKPQDKFFLKQKHGFSGKILLFFGAVDIYEERKGFKYLKDSLSLLVKGRPELVKKIVLIVAGTSSELPGLNDFEIFQTGHLSFGELANYYAMSDVFLSPTIQDAGPTMLSQALMCGTPAVAFEIGVAIDIVNHKTGYLAKYRDSEDFCKGIIYLLDKSQNELNEMSNECRMLSLEKSSFKAFRDQIIKVYNNVK